MAISENLQQTCCRGCEEKRTSLHSWWGYKSVHPLGKEYESQSESRSVVSDSFQPHGLYSLWNSPGQNTRVGSLSLLQGIFPTKGLNPGSPHCRRILYQLSHKGSPKSTMFLKKKKKKKKNTQIITIGSTNPTPGCRYEENQNLKTLAALWSQLH